MVLKINNTKFDLFTGLDVSLDYDSVSSTFAFSIYFDPENSDHKAAFRPGLYPPITIEEGNDLLLTGVILSYKFYSSSNKSLIAVSGYSKTGVLGDCEIPKEVYPLQSIGLTLKQIVDRITKPFGLTVIIDPAVSSRANTVYGTSIASDNGTAQDYIAKLAGQKQIMFTHNEKGELLLTEAKSKQSPIFDFSDQTSGISISLAFDGQKMHSRITLQKQATKKGKGNAGVSSYDNPYVTGFRPTINRQTSGAVVDTAYGARNVLSDELKAISLTINFDGWLLNGAIVRANNLITVTSPENSIYKKTKFFIQKVNYKGGPDGQTTTLECVVPECFNNETPVNIFL